MPNRHCAIYSIVNAAQICLFSDSKSINRSVNLKDLKHSMLQLWFSFIWGRGSMDVGGENTCAVHVPMHM